MVELAIGANGATVREHDMLGDREPQPSSSRFAGASLVHAVEALKQARQMLERNTRAEIAHVKFNPAFGTPRAQHQPPARGGVLERIVDQVGKNLMDGLAIGDDQVWR